MVSALFMRLASFYFWAYRVRNQRKDFLCVSQPLPYVYISHSLSTKPLPMSSHKTLEVTPAVNMNPVFQELSRGHEKITPKG